MGYDGEQKYLVLASGVAIRVPHLLLLHPFVRGWICRFPHFYSSLSEGTFPLTVKTKG